jgi:hypothetical protein
VKLRELAGIKIPVLLPLLLASSLLQGEIIPDLRRIQWEAGIPGNIPERKFIFTNLVNLDAGGVKDAAPGIQEALNRCPSNSVVRLPSGTFRMNSGITIPASVTLRGAGPSTVLKSYGSGAGLIRFGAEGMSYDPIPFSTKIASGALKSSREILVASATDILVGSYLIITELNDETFVRIQGSVNAPATWVDGWNTAGTRARGQIVEVTSVSGTTIHISPPLYSDYAHNPWATRFSAGCRWSGVEDLKISANNTGMQRNFLFQRAAYCWVKNVECDYTDGDHCDLDWSYRCEIRHCYFHDAYTHTSGAYDNMIGLRYKSSGCLVIDNILRRLHVSVMCEWGAAGNVIAYNYDEGNFDEGAASGNRWLPVSLNGNHGAHPQYNLFEGNYSQKFQADSYWGSSSHTTLLRNFFSGTGVGHPPYNARGIENTNITDVFIQGNRAVDIWELQSSHNVVGNIVGEPAMLLRGAVQKIVNPAPRAYDNPPYCFSYGYTSEASTGGQALESPVSTLLEHGNYDAVSGTIVWAPTIVERDIPKSYFLSSKPAFFGDLSWPPFNPAQPHFSPTNLPAGYRYIFGIDPPGSSATNAPPVVRAASSSQSGAAPLVVSFSANGSYDPEGVSLVYVWSFGDGTISTLGAPTHVYNEAGDYKACLSVSDGISTSRAMPIFIRVNAP